MKKLFKRTLAMVLTVALCVSTLQLTAFAAELDPVTPDAEEVIHDHDHSDAEDATTAENGGAEDEQEDQPLGADVETNVSTSNPADGEENPGTDTEEPSDEEETETDVEEPSVEEEPEADVEETSGEEEIEAKKPMTFSLRRSGSCDGKHEFAPAKDDNGTECLKCAVCGVRCYQLDRSGNHKPDEETISPTCEEDGYILETCGCGWKVKVESSELKAKGHQWSNWNTTKEPTCTAAGERTRTCKVCGKTEQEKLSAAGHGQTKKVVEEATCTEKGNITYYCTICGAEVDHVGIDPLGHDWDMEHGKVVEKISLTSPGKVIYTCKRDHSHTMTMPLCPEVDENGLHKLEKVVVEPTCTEKGSITYSCVKCGVLKVEEIEATGHKPKTEIVKPATCKEDGLQKQYCEKCGEFLGEGKIVQDPNNHVCLKDDGNLDWDVLSKRTVKIATCTEVGRIEYVCPGCGKVMETEEIPIDPTRHIHGNKLDEAQSIPATCTTPGKEVFVCVDCNAVLQEKELDLLGHIFSAWSPNGADNHIRTCERCHEEWTEVHKYGETVWGEWTDNEDGLTQTRVGVDTCGDCGHTVTKPETRTVNAYYTVEVYTVDANGNATLSRTETLKDRIGETVSTSGQVLAGYTLDGTRSTLSATLAESGTVLRVYYNANPTPPVTPGTTDDDDDDDDDDDEPYTPPTIVVPDEPAPLTPTPVGPVAPAAPVAPVTPVTPPTVEVEDPQVPLAENPGLVAGPLAEAGDDEVPLAVRAGWSLVNLLLTIFTALAAAWQLISRKKKDENEDEENTQNAQTTEEEDQDNRRSRLRLLSLVPAVGSVLLFIFNENLRNPMILVNRLTVVMVMIAAVQVALMVLTAQSEDDEDDRQEAARA